MFRRRVALRSRRPERYAPVVPRHGSSSRHPDVVRRANTKNQGPFRPIREQRIDGHSRAWATFKALVVDEYAADISWLTACASLADR